MSLDTLKVTKQSAATASRSGNPNNVIKVLSKQFNALVDEVSSNKDTLTTQVTAGAKTTKGQTTRVATAKTATATLTAAEVATGCIAVTSASAVTLTLPTGTLLGTELGATQGTVFDLLIDNTASTSSGVVTMAVATNGILSAGAAAVGASFGLLTVPVGVTGMAMFRLMFSSATAYTFTRVA